MELGFVIGFSFLTLLLLLILRFAVLHWLIKTALTCLSLGVVYAFYLGLLTTLGWPVADVPRCVMLIESVDIREPSDASAGEIFVWYINVDESVRTHRLGQPRAIRMPYTKNDHIKLAKAAGLIADGEPVYMQFAPQGPGLAPPMSDSRGYSGGRMDFVPPPQTGPRKQSTEQAQSKF